MHRDSRIYVAGHRGLVGSAIMRRLVAGEYSNLVTRTHSELDLTQAEAVHTFFEHERPEIVILAAAKVGGINANEIYPADFIYQNLAIQTNVIHAAYHSGVKRLLFLGSSCIYPRDCPQPIKEEYLLTGPLEPTNRPYAIAKIAGIEQCWSYNRQYGTEFLAVMPTNLYGPGDNYDLSNSHVIPALIRKFHEARLRGDREVVVWGTGTPQREFLFSEDMADACVYLLGMQDPEFAQLLGHRKDKAGARQPPLINVGTGEDLSIRELAELVRAVIGFQGEITFDNEKPDGTPRKLLDVTRLRNLGWQARTSIQAGLAATYRDYVNCSDILGAVS